jgi:drug/metabolite transporter (DMT)-like permease
MFTNKKFNLWQCKWLYCTIVAVLNLVSDLSVTMMAVALGLVGFNPTSVHKNVSTADHVYGLFCATAGAIFVSILSVMTQKLFATEQSKGNLTFVCEINTCQTFLATLLILPVACFSKEFRDLPGQIEVIRAAGKLPTMIGLLAGMAIASPFMLFTNIGLTSFSSATYARSLGGPKRLACVLLGWAIFHEEITVYHIVAAILLFLALGVYIYGGHLLQESKLKTQSK